jgi:hypothetical protein
MRDRKVYSDASVYLLMCSNSYLDFLVQTINLKVKLVKGEDFKKDFKRDLKRVAERDLKRGLKWAVKKGVKRGN